MNLPLTGIIVVSLEQAVAVPFATRQLADLGATVIKVERPGGGDFARNYDQTVRGLSSHFVWLNRNKKSITLDLKSESGCKTLHQLIAKADIFIQNLAPGAVERLGFDPKELCSETPRLITCSLSGYGQGGPMGNKKAYDLLIQAEAGFLSVTGTEKEPAKAGISIADISAGMYAYSGILSALYERETTGKGRQLTVSLLDSLTEWMGFPYYYARYGGTRPERAGAHHASIAPYGPISCLDGSVLIAVQNEREWERFCTSVIDASELATDERFSSVSNRLVNRGELNRIIGERLGALPTRVVIQALDDAGIAHGMMNDVAKLDTHPQLQARGRIAQVQTEAGLVNTFMPVVESPGWEPRFDAVPSAGADTNDVLEWLMEDPVPLA